LQFNERITCHFDIVDCQLTQLPADILSEAFHKTYEIFNVYICIAKFQPRNFARPVFEYYVIT
jgi:hypothetical protein